jgi:hypothetical protein
MSHKSTVPLIHGPQKLLGSHWLVPSHTGFQMQTWEFQKWASRRVLYWNVGPLSRRLDFDPMTETGGVRCLLSIKLGRSNNATGACGISYLPRSNKAVRLQEKLRWEAMACLHTLWLYFPRPITAHILNVFQGSRIMVCPRWANFKLVSLNDRFISNKLSGLTIVT